MFFRSQKYLPGSKEERRTILWSAFLCVFMAVLDQLTKYLVVRHIAFLEHVRIIPGCFDLTYVTNNGAAWNMLAGKFWLLSSISLVMMILLIAFYRKLSDGWQERGYAIALIISGIIGNSADRFFRGGEVVDFLHCYIGKYAWPTFNVADSCICIGVFLFILSNFLRPEEKKQDPTGGTSDAEK